MKLSQIFQKWRAEAKETLENAKIVVLDFSKPLIKKLYWELCWSNDEHNGELISRQLLLANVEESRDNKIIATYIRDQVIQNTNGRKTTEAIYVFNGMRLCENPAIKRPDGS